MDEQQMEAIDGYLDTAQVVAMSKLDEDAERPVFEVFEDSAQQWRWHLQAANGEILATGEGHGRAEDARRAIRAMRRNAVLAEVPE